MRVKDMITIQSITHHRNGVSGVPFNVVTFRYADPDARRDRNMVATYFNVEKNPKDDNPYCAVLDLDDVMKGVNSRWRGDYFADTLRDAILLNERKG